MDDRIDMLRPIVQHTWIDVRTVRPDNRAQLCIDAGLPEQVQITQWAKEGAEQDWQRWDRQLETDVAAGKLDFLMEEALSAKQQGNLKDL